MVLVKPATVVQWHRKGFRLYWRWRSRRPGRPKIGTRRRRPDPPTGHHARDRRADLESCTAGGRHLTERQVRDALEQFDAVWGDVFVPVGNLRSEILVVQSAQNWHRQRAADSLDGTRDRRVLVQR
jgi:hypothetical protein